MKVCHYIASAGLGRGEAYIDLVNSLCNHIDIVLLVPQGALFIHRVDPRIAIVEYTASDHRFNPFLHWEIFRKLSAIKADIVHTHFAKATEIFLRINKFLNIPHVATKHNPRKGRVFNRTDHVIAVSKGVAASISHTNVDVIYNGINPIAIQHPSPEARPSTPFKICAVGRLDPIKGFDRLITAVAQLDFEVELNIFGDGEAKEELSELINSLELQDRVTLRGFRTDVPELLAQHDLQVMSSLSEGFSLAMVEALFYSPMFISTNVPGCNEILPEQFIVEQDQIAAKIQDIHANYAQYQHDFSQLKNELKPQLDIASVAQKYIHYYLNMQKDSH